MDTAIRKEWKAMSYGGLIVIIPTRDRPDLAQDAIGSVLSQPDCEVQVLVSDNSTTSADRAELSGIGSRYRVY